MENDDYLAFWRYLPAVSAGKERDVEDILQDPAILTAIVRRFKYDVDDMRKDPLDPAATGTPVLLYDNPFLAANHEHLDPTEYTYIISIWVRVNVAALINNSSNSFFFNNPYTRDKLQRFCDSHLPIVRYLDGLDNPRDDLLDKGVLRGLWKNGAGPSYYGEDEGLIKVKGRVELELLRRPLEVLRDYLEEVDLNPERVDTADYLFSEYHYDPIREQVLDSENDDGYELYKGCIIVMQTLVDFQVDCPSTEASDAAHSYYVAFMDLFAHALDHQEYRYLSDAYLIGRGMPGALGVTPWQLFNPYFSDTRAFHAGDLPDMFGTLTDIPLRGEQHKPAFLTAKVFQKCLPFCGQRRVLIKVVRDYTRESPAFWRLFSKVFWCLLAGMYPGDKVRPKMEELLRIRQLTDTATARELLGNALQIGEYEGSAMVVFTAFRRYLTYMAAENEYYKVESSKCIDWAGLEVDTLKMAELVRGSNLLPADAFGRARILLSKMGANNSKIDVYRYRKTSCIKMLAGHCNTILEKLIYQSHRDWSADKALLAKVDPSKMSHKQARTLIKGSYVLEQGLKADDVPLMTLVSRLEKEIEWNLTMLERDIELEHKENLLNVLFKVPIKDRLKALSFSLMRLPKYGGVSMTTIEVMSLLVDNYYNKNAAPRKFLAQLRRLTVYDFKLVCCYFNMLLRLDKINFVVWDANTVQRIDKAMLNRRNVLFPGQVLPKHSFNVIIKLCCQRIATFKGRSFFGHRRVAYDINERYLVCSEKKGKKGGDDDDDEIDNVDDDGDGDEELMGEVDGVSQSILDDTVNQVTEQDQIEEARKQMRRQRKDFLAIPCAGQPVLNINLRGLQLVWGNERDKKTRYAHCPECGCLHECKWQFYSKSQYGLYRCSECMNKDDLVTHSFYECAYCLARPRNPINTFDAAETSLYIMDPLTSGDPIVLTYFCKRHYRYAKAKASQLPKNYLWKYIHKKEQSLKLRAALGIFNK